MGGNKNTRARSVYVVGEDIYAVGREGNPAKVWKNGEELYELANNGEAYSIVVYNGDVYVAGGERKGSILIAKVWKNGKELYSLSDNNSNALSIFIAERE